MDAGADLCVVSIHKMGAGLEQGSVFHLQGDLVDPSRLRACADMLSTTSPNVLMYAAMDGWRRQMVQLGHELLTSALNLAADVRDRIGKLPGPRVLHDELLGAEASKELDPLKVLVDLADLGISGYQAADWLRAHHGVDVGLSDHRRIEAQLTIADDAVTADLLLDALTDLTRASDLPGTAPIKLPLLEDLDLETVMLPRDAFFTRTQDIPVTEAVGRICAEQVTPYPPGIPVLFPGERIGRQALDYLVTGVQAGMVVPDATAPQLETVRVAPEPRTQMAATRQIYLGARPRPGGHTAKGENAADHSRHPGRRHPRSDVIREATRSRASCRVVAPWRRANAVHSSWPAMPSDSTPYWNSRMWTSRYGAFRSRWDSNAGRAGQTEKNVQYGTEAEWIVRLGSPSTNDGAGACGPVKLIRFNGWPLSAPPDEAGAQVRAGARFGLRRLVVGLRGARTLQVGLRFATALSASLEDVPVADAHGRPARPILDKEDRVQGAGLAPVGETAGFPGDVQWFRRALTSSFFDMRDRPGMPTCLARSYSSTLLMSA
jgi:hypothetical protein